MKRIYAFIILVSIAAAWSCMTVSTIPLGSFESRPAANPERVNIYLTERDVPREYEKIALIYGEEILGEGIISFEEMIRRMKRKAAKMGANGLILGEMGRSFDLEATENNTVEITSKKHLKAVAIYVK
jgi:hypothetical protein